MARKLSQTDFQNIPACAADFIKLVIKKMRYRKKVRADVQTELIAHFEDQLKDSKTDGERDQRAEQLIADFGDPRLLGVLLRRAKKRCRPLWRTIVARTFQSLGILILCFITYCVYISLGRPTIHTNYVEEATRLTRPVADESLNAAPLYQKAFDAYKEPPKIEQQDILTAIKDKDWITDLTEQELSLLKQWLLDNAEAIEMFKQASRKPHCWWQRTANDAIVIAVLMPELKPIRDLVKMIVRQAKLKAYQGDVEGAFDDVLACYQTGMHFKGPRGLIQQLIGISVQALSTRTVLTILTNQKVDSQLLQSFQANLDALIAADTFVINYETERFLAADFIQRCYTDNGRGSGHMVPLGLKEFYAITGMGGGFVSGLGSDMRFLSMSILSADRDDMTRMFEQAYDNFQQWAYKTPWQLRQENVGFEMDMESWSWLKKTRYWPFTLLMPALERVSQISHGHKAQTYALVTTIAALRYKQATDSFPASLDELVTTGYLKERPMDPFSDKPLVYKKTDDNFMLYSVGFNFTDDGGMVIRNEAGKVERWSDEGDFVFWPIPKTVVKKSE